MLRSKITRRIALILVLAGTAITLYTVFDGKDTSANIANTGYAVFAAGLLLTFVTSRYSIDNNEDRL